jgi:hypothetical protein
MQIPSPDSFTHESGYWVGPPWWARLPGADFDLFVSEWEDGPDPDSLAFAERVLPRVYGELRAAAVRYLTGGIRVSWIPRMEAENAGLVSLFCDAGSRTVILEMSWEIDLDHLWWVEFHDHPLMGLHPVAFGMRGWGGSRPPWRAPFRSVNG